MFIRTFNKVSYKRLPLLIKDDGTPLLHTFIFCITSKFIRLRYNTQYSYLITIRELYNAFKILDYNLDNILLNGDFRIFFSEFGRSAQLFIFKNEIKIQNQIIKLDCIKNYIKWSIDRHLNRNANPIDVDYIKSVDLDDFFNTFILRRNNTGLQFKSLTSSQLKSLHEIIQVNSDLNPFTVFLQNRNYLILRILLDTGIRIGELLNLTTLDIKIIADVPYLVIGRHEYMATDKRTRRPSIKTDQSNRLVAISKNLYEKLLLYIKKDRRNNSKISHPYIFTAKNNDPISINAIYDIFNKINNVGILSSPTWEKITPHILRHTFAYDFLKYLIEVHNYDMERAKDELRKICGWKNNSSLPLHYTGKYIWELSNGHNIKRISQYYE
ncbi:tyrosine-type recombinase/integrase [Chryseobacterium lathyri]|uniref:Integrase n=1 Tax=Chryseobacterium lathyri TaxID=395933 RepID=A0ABT9SK19_9FLAO|nr:site-specific integrase [Chryseobacterium lathyri]MDP9959777.1 integrase [Chryseobacterium lathyri]